MTQVNGLSPLLSEKGTTLKILPLHWASHWQSLLGGGGQRLKGLEQQTFFQVLFYGKFSTMLISARETPKALGQRIAGVGKTCWSLCQEIPGAVSVLAYPFLLEWSSVSAKGSRQKASADTVVVFSGHA